MLPKLSSLLFLLVLVSCQGNGTADPDPAGPGSGTPDKPGQIARFLKATIGTRVVNLEVADTPNARADGLSGRTSLAKDTGMIFLYPDAHQRDFWMGGCKIGIDIAFLDADRRIFQIASLDPPTATPGRVEEASSTGPAQTVVEMSKGWFAAAGFAVGDTFVFSDELGRRASAIAW